MSEYSDVLYDPKSHTHEDCLKEVVNADAVVLIIGSRFGGTAIPAAVASIDIETLKNASTGGKVLEAPEKLSVTQLEVLKAIDAEIPIFAFVDSRVMHDHLVYEKNKDKAFLSDLVFPSIDNDDSAVYIFEFINFLRLRARNNSVTEFSKFADIEDHLRKQWSALLQRMLIEQRQRNMDLRKTYAISEELKDIKSLILSNIASSEAREIGRGVLRYRRLIEFLFSLGDLRTRDLLLEDKAWDEILAEFEIIGIAVVRHEEKIQRLPLIYILKSDGTFYSTTYQLSLIQRLQTEWETFRALSMSVKTEIVSALFENSLTSFNVKMRHINRKFSAFLKEVEEKRGASVLVMDSFGSDSDERTWQNFEEISEEEPEEV